MTFLVGWAWKTGQLPDEVLERYDNNPRNFYLLMAYGMYEAECEKQATEEEQKKAEKAAKQRRAR